MKKPTLLSELAGMIGLLAQEPEVFLRGGKSDLGISEHDIDDLIHRRNQARDAKDWAESDRIRDLLNKEGIVLEDAGGNTTWRRE